MEQDDGINVGERDSKENDGARQSFPEEKNEIEEPLDNNEVLLSIFQGVDLDDERVRKRTKAEEEWEWQMKCTQDWFIRSSWINKFLFVESLCKSTNGTNVLETILKTTELIFSKDVLQSLAKGHTDFFYDKIPIDDNRALREADLKKAMEKDFVWFVNLPTTSQISVILRLLQLGGGGLIFSIYKKVKKLYEERQSFYNFLSAVPSTLEEAKASVRLKAARSSKFRMSRLSFEFENEKQEIKEHTKKKLEEIERRESELLKYKKSKGILGRGSKTLKKQEPKEVIDYLQILPVGLNRKIMSYIDEKTLLGLRKVGRYWGKMIDESINEKTGRKAINAKINKIIELKSGGAFGENDEEKKEIGEGEAEEEEEESKEEQEKWEQVEELGSKKLLSDKKKNERALLKADKKCEGIFSQKYITIRVDDSSFRDRFCCLDKKMETLASTTLSNFVHFYSVRTGARLKFSLFGFESLVTCMEFHEDRIHIFVGLKDGSLLSKDFRTNKTRGSFKGHSQSIKSLFTTSTNLLSSSSDNTIKYFQLWSGVCLLCIDFNKEFNISSLLLRNDKQNCCIVGTNEGVLILVDVEKKCFLNKAKLCREPIKFLAQNEDLLITATKLGKIRVWDLQKFENKAIELTPYYNISTNGNLSSLTLHQNQIFIGLDNGNLKIISLASGEVFKSLQISDEKISGLALAEDKFNLKVIIWNEGGIQMKSFPLSEPPFNKKSIKNLNRKEEREKRGRRKGDGNKTSDTALTRFVGSTTLLCEPKSYRKTTFLGSKKKSLGERCCTASAMRRKQKNHENFKTDIFTEIVNENNLLPTEGNFVETFSRCKYMNPKKK